MLHWAVAISTRIPGPYAKALRAAVHAEGEPARFAPGTQV